MGPPYKRRRSVSLIRNFWVYRRVVLAAMVLGLVLWFTVINNAPVTVFFPFGLGSISSSSGGILLIGVITGALITILLVTVWWTMRKMKSPGLHDDLHDPDAIPEDRPPDDYAARTGDGFSDAPWSAR